MSKERFPEKLDTNRFAYAYRASARFRMPTFSTTDLTENVEGFGNNRKGAISACRRKARSYS